MGHGFDGLNGFTRIFSFIALSYPKHVRGIHVLRKKSVLIRSIRQIRVPSH